jgi:hypothetical protein
LIKCFLAIEILLFLASFGKAPRFAKAKAETPFLPYK